MNEIKSEIKWNEQFSNEHLYWKNIYLATFKSTNGIRLRSFQCKFLMRIIPTNQFLAKCQIVNSSLCEFCNMEIETVLHLFWECTFIQQFWASLSDFLNLCDINININLKTFSFGVIQSNSNRNVIVQNFVIY